MVSASTAASAALAAETIKSEIKGNNPNEQEEENAEGEGEPGKKKMFRSWREWGVAGVGGASVVLNTMRIPILNAKQPDAFRIYFNGAKGFGYTSSAIGIAVAPVAIYNETRLQRDDSLREMVNKLRGEINRMDQENEKLSFEISKLQKNVDTMNEIEDALRELTVKQGSDLDTFMNLIKENAKISQKMNELLRARVCEDVVSLVLQSDRDGDFHLEGFEIEEVIIGLKLIQGLEFDENSFRQKVIDSGGSVRWVLSAVRNLLEGEVIDDAALGVNKDESAASFTTNDRSLLNVSRSSFLASVRGPSLTTPEPLLKGDFEEEQG